MYFSAYLPPDSPLWGRRRRLAVVAAYSAQDQCWVSGHGEDDENIPAPRKSWWKPCYWKLSVDWISLGNEKCACMRSDWVCNLHSRNAGPTCKGISRFTALSGRPQRRRAEYISGLWFTTICNHCEGNYARQWTKWGLHNVEYHHLLMIL